MHINKYKTLYTFLFATNRMHYLVSKHIRDGDTNTRSSYKTRVFTHTVLINYHWICVTTGDKTNTVLVSDESCNIQLIVIHLKKSTNVCQYSAETK